MSPFRWPHPSLILLLFCLVFNSLAPTPTVQAQTPAPQTIESDAPQVATSGQWQSQATPQASGGSYRYSSGAEADVLTLAFEGTTLEVVYIAGPSLGTLAIEVDGTVLRTVITTADDTAYGQLARVDYLSSEPHVLKVYAQAGGVIAVDAFIVHATDSADFSNEPVANDDAGGIQSSVCAPLNAIARVSLGPDGQEGNQESSNPDLSADGRYVAFDAYASNLVVSDTNQLYDVFVYDRQICRLEVVSINNSGVLGNGSSTNPSISDDGRYVAFLSSATNLVSGDTNAQYDVFVHDRQTNTTTRVSVATGGTQATGGRAYTLDISANGRYVAFESTATNLVSGDTNGEVDVFVHDRQTNTTTRVSVAAGGTQGNDPSNTPTISADGRFVAFESFATNLVSGDTNGQYDVFVHDRQTATTTRVSVATGGTQATGGMSANSVISADGRYVAFDSAATNLVTGDTNTQRDVFVHDRQTNTTTRVSVATGGTQATGTIGGSVFPAMSGDARYVVFVSMATNLVPGDTNAVQDAFVHDRQTNTTNRASVGVGGIQANSHTFSSAISADGRLIAFHSVATNLVAGDTSAIADVFVTSRSSTPLDTLALFSPSYNYVSLINTLADSPPYTAFTAFSAYAPVNNGQWVMGDWNGDGLDTPGVYANFIFYFTNKASESQASDWGGFWIGVNGPPVAGRFSNAVNDCIGAVDSSPSGGMTIFALYFNCDFSGVNPAPPLTFQWLSAPLPDPTFTGTFQFMAGDFNGDGLDSIAVRRNEFIAFGNVNPAAGPAAFDLAQYIGAPGTSDNGSFVVGDWDGNGLDSFGLFYQNGELFYRNDLDFNSGVYLNQSVGTPFAGTVQVATWR
ncbi:MAG: hypothetical protein K8L91_28525 [Anaerolineae bacterium]|nr:hypothetical protein [Anaerolineae bacterium]